MSRKRRISQPAQKKIKLKRPGSRGSGNIWKSKTVKTETRAEVKKSPKDFSKVLPLLGFAFITIILTCSISFTLLYSYRYFTSSQYFALKTIEIKGNTRLSSRNILDLISVNEKSNLLDLSINAVEAALVNNPWIKSASVTRIMPDALLIRVKEKTPAFWQLNEGILNYADMYGETIATVELGQISPLPFLEVEKGAEDIKSALPELLQSLYGASIALDMRKITRVRLSASRGLELNAEDNQLKITIALEGWLDNLQKLGTTVADLRARGDFEKVISIKAQGANVWVEQNTDISGT